MPRSTGENWIGTTDLAVELGITVRTLYRLIDRGELTAYKFGWLLRVKRVDVAAYLDTHRG